ncbi:MAG TPA: hypothetical protein VMV18_12025 [bacterium]|nr:hypothetical protein [bacterium]
MKSDVQVDLYTKKSALVVPGEEQQQEAAGLTEQILSEVAALNAHVKLAIHDATVDAAPARAAGVEAFVPAIVFRAPAAKGTLRYFGLPAGYEFKTLVDALVSLGTDAHGLADESVAALAGVSEPVNLKVYVTPG